MHFLSTSDLLASISKNIYKVPHDVDLIVGIPRSGMIPAYQIGLMLNLPVTDISSFIRNEAPLSGYTRKTRSSVEMPMASKKILLVDDSYFSGGSMAKSVDLIRNAGFQGELLTCSVITRPNKSNCVDIAFVEVPVPRVFEWNLFHHPIVEEACFDFDGVLCVDPPETENDDGPRYRNFVLTAPPLYIPTYKIGHIVSARLEKYRPECEAWLKQHGVKYGELHLVNLPNKEERIRTQAHIPHKARVYNSTNAKLFVESSSYQAKEIATRTKKPVVCTDEMSFYNGMDANIKDKAAYRIKSMGEDLYIGEVKHFAKRVVQKFASLRAAR